MNPSSTDPHAHLLRQTEAMRAARAAGQTMAQIATAFELSAPTVWRRLQARARFDAGHLPSLAPGKSTGRKPIAKELSMDAINRLKRQRIKCGSTATALKHFADDPLCPDALQEYIRKHIENGGGVPLSLRRACHVTPEAEAQYRGPVAYQHIAFKCRHEATVIDPISDQKRDLLAGDIYISDDMSRNRYFWFELGEAETQTRTNRGDKLAARHGVALGRQGLFTMDVRGKWLGLTLVGCARDAYTAADVLRHMRHVLAEYGKPRLGWILEKGVWSANTIDGNRIAVPEDERDRTVSGLKALGFIVDHVHTSEGKALIESGFNHLQRVQALQDDAPDIGRKRGEMERETKLIERVQQGVLHPAEAGLEHFTEALGLDTKALVWLNSRRKFGRIQNGVPDEVWLRDVARFSLAPLAECDHGHLMPVKLETTIRQGCVQKTIGGQPYRFTKPELFAHLGTDYRLLMCFDDTDPEAGAHLYNLETGARNTRGFAFMEWLGLAEWESDRPMFGYSDEVGESMDRRRRYARAFKSGYAGTGIFGKRARKIVETRDGRGQLERVEVVTPVAAFAKNADTPSPSPLPLTSSRLPATSFRRGVVSQQPDGSQVDPPPDDAPRVRIRSRQQLAMEPEKVLA